MRLRMRLWLDSEGNGGEGEGIVGKKGIRENFKKRGKINKKSKTLARAI